MSSEFLRCVGMRWRRERHTVLLAVVFLLGCATSTPKKIESALRSYRSGEGHKAFALARDSSGAAAWGWTFGEANVEEAKRRALAHCEAQRPIFMIQSQCVLYAVNDLVVYEAPSPESDKQPPSRGTTSTGTCFAVRDDGVVLTARHVIRDAAAVMVTLANGETLAATPEASSEALDLAVLRVAAPTPNYLRLAETGATRTGSRVFTLGYPAPDILGPEAKYSDGAISSMSGPGGEVALLQISVPVQPGNSGGPVVDFEGRVVGVVTSTAAIMPFLRETGTLPQNVNWAISAEFARPLFRAPASTPSSEVQPPDVVDYVRQALCSVRAMRR
jgi:S1-C subfamily serine protease